MERLSHIIEVAVGQRMWKPIRLSRGGPPLSHLAFADDLVLLSEASMDQADIISSCIDLFCESSGQKVNSDKTRIYFSDNVCSQVREQISSSLGFQRTADLGKYLGVPLFHKRENRSTFAPIMDKINQRLSAWKAKSLSMAGRLTLTKSVLAAMPSYVMQSTSLPIAVCQEVDKACRNFLWGDTTESHRIHLLEWKKVCQPIQHGGLGLRQSSIVNKAFMMKVGWDLIMDREALWARVIRSKYKCGNDILPCVQRRQVSSNLWRGVSASWGEVDRNLVWRLGNGLHIDFWDSCWVSNLGPLRDKALVPIEAGVHRVRDFLGPNGGWNVQKVRRCLPDSICKRIFAMAPPNLSRKDAVAWGSSSDGWFTVQSAYNCIVHHGPSNVVFDLIWKWQGPQRYRIHLWKVARAILLSGDMRVRRGFAVDATCSICSSANESLLHVFRDCFHARKLWEKLIPFGHVGNFFSLDLNEWITWNLSHACGRYSKPVWSLIFGVVLHHLWWRRNKLIFEGVTVNLMASLCHVWKQVRDIQVAGPVAASLRHPVRREGPIYIRWHSPPEGWVKLNTDGSVLLHSNSASCGGVLRDHWGAHLFSFSSNLGFCNILGAELWGIYQGLFLTKSRGFKLVIVESDSSNAISLISKRCHHLHPYASLVGDIKDLLRFYDAVVWQHVHREGNSTADALASLGHSMPIGTRTFDVLPACAVLQFSFDSASSFVLREIR